jgi:hypothetical protein
MRRFAIVVSLLLGAICLLTLQPAVIAGNPDHKVFVCHVPPGNPANAHIIDVDLSAWLSGHTPHTHHNMDQLCSSEGGCPACVCAGTVNPETGECEVPQ